MVAELPPRYRDRVVRLIEPGDPLVTQALEARGPGWSIARGNTCRDRGDCHREAHTFMGRTMLRISQCNFIILSYSILFELCQQNGELQSD